MGFALDAHSIANLKGVHPDLIKVLNDCAANGMMPFTFGVSEGCRTLDKQKACVAAGVSQTMDSRHLYGLAVDLVVLLPGNLVTWAWPPYHALATEMKKAGQRVGVPIIAGADWLHFPDGPHFELPRINYPDK